MSFRSLISISLLASAFASTMTAGPVIYALSFKYDTIFGTIDPATGLVTPIGAPVPLGSHDLAISPAGAVDGVFGSDLLTIDKTTAATGYVGTFTTDIQSLAFRSDGALFGVAGTSLY